MLALLSSVPSSLSSRSSVRVAALMCGLTGVALSLGCPRGDLGAPCQHGDVTPPESTRISFPVPSCDELLCVYAETGVPMDDCSTNEDCNAGNNGGENRFICETGARRCVPTATWVAERSVCSRRCEQDSDCADGGDGGRVEAKESSCSSGFKCAILQELGRFCCEKVCVCADDVGPPSRETEEKCGPGRRNEVCCKNPDGSAKEGAPKFCSG